MTLKDNYAKVSDIEENKEKKTVLSDDAFAVCDFIEQLIIKMEQVRIDGRRRDTMH